jgi:hypothetical protein
MVIAALNAKSYIGSVQHSSAFVKRFPIVVLIDVTGEDFESLERGCARSSDINVKDAHESTAASYMTLNSLLHENGIVPLT